MKKRNGNDGFLMSFEANKDAFDVEADVDEEISPMQRAAMIALGLINEEA